MPAVVQPGPAVAAGGAAAGPGALAARRGAHVRRAQNYLRAIPATHLRDHPVCDLFTDEVLEPCECTVYNFCRLIRLIQRRKFVTSFLGNQNRKYSRKRKCIFITSLLAWGIRFIRNLI